jgi:CRP-like cAMP-binding protein
MDEGSRNSSRGEIMLAGPSVTTESGQTEVPPPELVAAMRRNPFLALLPDDELRGLLRESVSVETKADELLTTQGQEAEHVYFILDGQAKAVINGTNREDSSAVLDLLSAGGDIGLLSVVDDAPHSANVVSMIPLSAIRVPKSLMRDILDSHPVLYKVLLQISLGRLRNSGSWMECLL